MIGTYFRLQLDVGASWRDVVRAASRRLTPAARRDPVKRALRKVFYREMLTHHQDAQQLADRFRL